MAEYDPMLRPVAQAMRSGKGRVFVGAGLSVPSGLGSWLDLLRPIVLDGLRLRLNQFDDLPEVAQFYADQVPGGRERLIAAIAADVARKDVVPNKLHEALRALPIAECWTTNFDSLLEQALPDHLVIEDDAGLAAATTQPRPLLVKMHGTLAATRPSAAQVVRTVITRDDFDDFQQRHPRLWSRIAAGYLSGSMLFLGLSLTDPNMRLLQRLARAASRSGVDSTSVVVMKVPDDEQERLRFEPRTQDLARSGVTVLSIDEYDDLPAVLEGLREMLRPPRVIISGSETEDRRGSVGLVVRAAELLGEQLAQRNISIVHGGSEPGAALSRRLAETATLLRSYNPTAITAVRRRVMHGDEYIGYPPGPGAVGMPRDGTIRFVGETPDQMRVELARLGCAVAVLGGGDGTAQEIRMFEAEGLAVVPWPATGGQAARHDHLLDELLTSIVPEGLRGQTHAALRSSDMALGAVAMATLLDSVQRPYADTGPISSGDPLSFY